MASFIAYNGRVHRSTRNLAMASFNVSNGRAYGDASYAMAGRINRESGDGFIWPFLGLTPDQLLRQQGCQP